MYTNEGSTISGLNQLDHNIINNLQQSRNIQNSNQMINNFIQNNSNTNQPLSQNMNISNSYNINSSSHELPFIQRLISPHSPNQQMINFDSFPKINLQIPSMLSPGEIALMNETPYLEPNIDIYVHHTLITPPNLRTQNQTSGITTTSNQNSVGTNTLNILNPNPIPNINQNQINQNIAINNPLINSNLLNINNQTTFINPNPQNTNQTNENVSQNSNDLIQNLLNNNLNTSHNSGTNTLSNLGNINQNQSDNNQNQNQNGLINNLLENLMNIIGQSHNRRGSVGSDTSNNSNASRLNTNFTNNLNTLNNNLNNLNNSTSKLITFILISRNQ